MPTDKPTDKDIRNAMIPEIILKVKSLLELELISVMEDISELESILQEEERKNEFLLNKVEELEAKNKELSDKLKSKTSSSIWENMQVHIQEKDKQIEQIKKELDFYKRNHNLKITEPQTGLENKPVKKDIVKEEKNKVKEVKEVIKEEEVEEIKPEDKPKKKKKTKSKKQELDPEALDDLEKELLN
jgi:hypothetical protein